MAYLDKDGLQAFYTGLKAKFATNTDYEVAFPASGWSNSLPYSQTVNVPGLLAYCYEKKPEMDLKVLLKVVK